jgi:serine/threonine protein kinase
MSSSARISSWIGVIVGDRDRYRITEHIGGGGMGDVFLAVDTILGQDVAIKLLKERLVDKGNLKKRFEREVLLCAAIKSENVVQVRDYGLTNKGYPYYVMEYLQGQTLARVMRREKKVSLERTIYIINQICNGLQFAHQGVSMWNSESGSSEVVQVVHRDLKPANIFLMPTSLGELVKILDFGIAKITGQLGETESDATNTGTFIGTFQYASPEQLEAIKDIDGRADIYSLGMIMYEMISGHDPFGFDSAGKKDSSGMRWVRAHTVQTPIPLRSQPGCENLPPALEAAVMRCLEKDRNDRFATVEELTATLKASLDSRIDDATIAHSMIMQAHQEAGGAMSSPLPNVGDRFQKFNAANRNEADPQTAEMTPKRLPEQTRAHLERLLLSYVGPIATILLKQAIAQAFTIRDLVEHLVHNVPDVNKAKFRSQVNALLQNTNDETEPGTKPQFTNLLSSALSPESRHAPSQLSGVTQINPAFLSKCEAELANFIGPMAKLIVQNANRKLSPPQFIESLAQRIPNPVQADKFRQRMLADME